LLIPRRNVAPDETRAEVHRLKEAISTSIDDLSRLRQAITAKHGKEIGAIFDFHLGLLKDKTLVKQITLEITTLNTTAEYAVSVVMRRYASNFLEMSDRYLSERVKDIHDIETRLL